MSKYIHTIFFFYKDKRGKDSLVLSFSYVSEMINFSIKEKAVIKQDNGG